MADTFGENVGDAAIILRDLTPGEFIAKRRASELEGALGIAGELHRPLPHARESTRPRHIRPATATASKRVPARTAAPRLGRRLEAPPLRVGVQGPALFRKLVKADEALARKVAVLTSIPGVVAITAAGLLAGMPELGRLDAKAVSSLAGLAPVARESGQWKGRRFIGGGRGRVRKLLYMAALSAVQHNPDLAVVYSRLRERGKPGKVAPTAVMRKLIVLANTLLKEDREWALRPSARAPEHDGQPPDAVARPRPGRHLRDDAGHPAATGAAPPPSRVALHPLWQGASPARP